MAASLELAISAIRAGRKEEGRQLLNLLIQRNPNDDMAWLWMSSVVDTDEQRARCLYHVLAINPNSELAQRGLKLLGIVVSDSRPVKVPRDSQPIKIPKPTSDSRPLSLNLPQPEAQSRPSEERRPFRIDPKAIVDELPFTPVKPPFGEAADETASPNKDESQEDKHELPQAPQPDGQPSLGSTQVMAEGPTSTPARSQPIAQAAADSRPMQAQNQGQSASNPSEPVPPVQPPAGGTPSMPPDHQSRPPSEPVLAQPQSGPQSPDQLGTTGSLNAPQQPMSGAQQSFGEGGIPHETRPSQPVPVTHSNTTVNMPQQGQYPGYGQAPQYQHPSEPMPAVHSNATMGMPTQFAPAQGPSQSLGAIHSNATMGMPSQGQPNAPMPNQGQHPSEPVPVQQPSPYGYPQYQQNPAIHSNSTMAMPLGYDPFAALRAASNQDYRVANSQGEAKRKKNEAEEEEDGEEINILAVIIFGSLSITALGGLGMLILLMFTTG